MIKPRGEADVIWIGGVGHRQSRSHRLERRGTEHVLRLSVGSVDEIRRTWLDPDRKPEGLRAPAAGVIDQ